MCQTKLNLFQNSCHGGPRLVAGKSGQFYEKLHEITDKLHHLGTKERRGDTFTFIHLSETWHIVLPGSEVDCPANNNHLVDNSPGKCLNKSNGCNIVEPGVDLNTTRVPLKEISAYLTLLEGGKPEDKLECQIRNIVGTNIHQGSCFSYVPYVRHW